MPTNILIIKNMPREGAGLLGTLLQEFGIGCTITDLDPQHPLPKVSDYAAIVVLGGHQSANDQTEHMLNELTIIRDALEAKIPYLGICLGLQTLVKAAGGSVLKNAIKEVGFIAPDHKKFTVELCNQGKADAIFAGLSEPFEVFQLHGETVELTDKMMLLGTGKFCHNQIVKINTNAYGIQCHFELTPDMFETWINEDPDLLTLDTGELRAHFQTIQEQYTRTGRQLFTNFLSIAGLISG